MAESPAELQAEIEKLERKHADNPEGRYFVPLANAYRKLGAVEHAESLLRAGLERHPDYLSAHIVLGRCLADRQAIPDAVAEFSYVLSLDPQNLIALRTLGELAWSEGKAEEAGHWYQELLAVDPMNEDARRALESLQLPVAAPEAPEEFQPGRGWWEPAAEDGDGPGPETGGEAEDGAEGDEVVTETIAELYLRQGFRDRAAEVYRELIRRRGGDPALERRLAEIEDGGPAGVEGEEGEAEEEEEIVIAPIEGLEHSTPFAEEVEEEEEDDAFAASFTTGFSPDEELVRELDDDATGPTIDLDDAPAPPPPPAGPSIRQELGEVLAWRPGTAPVEAPGEERPAVVEEAEPAMTSGPAMEIPDVAPVEAATDGTEPAADEPFPWEANEPASELPDDWSPAPTAEPEEPAADGQPADADDDLESFQAWLRSLKR